MMNQINIFKAFALLFAAFLIQGCIEPVEFQTETFESLPVIEATITDELKHQEISVTRTFMFEEEGPSAERNAEVSVTDDAQNEYVFEEVDPGQYRSLKAFKAEAGRTYQLRITTAEGITYVSDPMELARSSAMDNLYARRTSNNGEDGIALQVDNFNTAEASAYYRYEYEETYKIISRYSWPFDLVVRNGRFVEVRKTREETTCYNTRMSQNIILASTGSLSGNDLEGVLVRFINSRDPVLSRRYSILVRQYAISRGAHSYYSTVRKLAGSDNLFSQNQPGFVAGNIYSPEDPGKKVVGFFNVSSVSSERIFFNFTDFFDGEDPPLFPENCNPASPPIFPEPTAENLMTMLERGMVKYLGRTPPTSDGDGPYRVVEAPCVDCTLLGTNVVPEFWEE